MSIRPAELATVFKILGDPTRLRALLILRREELTVTELTALLGVAQSTASGLLKTMMEAGLIETRREGRHAYYRARTDNDLVARAVEGVSAPAADLQVLMQIRQARLIERGDPLAGAFERSEAPGRSWKTLARSLLQLVDFGVVADLGIGSGELTLLLARAARRVYAVDREPALLSDLERRAGEAGVVNIVPVAGDFEALQLPSRVDLVVISLSLAAAAEPLAVLKGAAENLRPGGRIWITELANHDQQWTRERFGHKWLGFDPADLAAMLVEAGFRDPVVTPGAREKRPPYFQTLVAVGNTPPLGGRT